MTSAPVTAGQLDQSKISVDWFNLKQGKNIPRAHTPSIETIAAWDQIRKRLHADDVAYYDLPNQLDAIADWGATRQLIEKFRGRSTDVIVLGIGGSSLGLMAVMQAMAHRVAPDAPRVHVIENPDPIELRTRMHGLNPKTTLLVPVTKSGTTFETLAQFMAILGLWQSQGFDWKSQVVVITDPVKGDLRAWATRHHIPSLKIHPALGGRFSVFSPVGTFVAGLCGLNVEAMFQGAKQITDDMEAKGRTYQAGAALVENLWQMRDSHPMHVWMPYASSLKQSAFWFVQLWAESLGKDGKGFTPIASQGAVDQHSVLQLLRDGPNNKVIWMISVGLGNFEERKKWEVAIPDHESILPDLRAFRQLTGHGMHELLDAERQATQRVLLGQDRPILHFHLDQMDEATLGALYQFHFVLTTWMGSKMAVNPFDQPGVEEGKIYIRELLEASKRARNP